MKKTFLIEVKGKDYRWLFTFKGNKEDMPDWLSDGLEVCEIVNTVPYWAANLGLLKPWIFCQDVWNKIRLW